MSVLIQYDFFETKEQSEISCLKKEIEKLRVSLDKQRKAQFARIGEMTKKTLDLEERLGWMEAALCKKIK